MLNNPRRIWAALMVSIFLTLAPTIHADEMSDAIAGQWDVKRCINFGNALDAPNEGEWGWVIDKAHIKAVAEAGFDTIRLPVRFSAHSASGPDYTLDPDFMARTATVIDQALSEGLNVIVVMHHYEALMLDPAGEWPKLKSLWMQIGEEFKGLPTDRVYFEAINEPNDQLSGDAMRIVQTQILTTIRSTNPDRIVIFGGDHWSNISNISSLPSFEDKNVVLTFHYYDPFPFTHQKAPWVGDDGPKERRGWGSKADRDELSVNTQVAQSVMAATGRPLFMGEFGAYEKAPYNDRLRYIEAVRQSFESVGVSWCAWSFTATFPYYQEGKGWDEHQLKALGLR